MAQLTLDIDSEVVATGETPPKKRITRFVSKHFDEGQTRHFKSYRDLDLVISATRRSSRLVLGREALSALETGDRLVLEVRSRRDVFRWFNGAASVVQHILDRADPEFLQTAPVALPAYVGAEVGFDLSASSNMKDIAHALIQQMLVKHLLLAPPLIGLHQRLRESSRAAGRQQIDLEVDGHAFQSDEVAGLEVSCRRALAKLLKELHEVFPALAFPAIDLDAVVRAIGSGRPLTLPLFGDVVQQ